MTLKKKKYIKKIIVAMSGGIDSTVTMMLLRRCGYNAIGIFLQLMNNNKMISTLANQCCSYQNSRNIRKICEYSNTFFFAINVIGSFTNRIIKPFVKSYLLGYTPNPCIDCNNIIKFGFLYKISILLNSLLASGHYSRVKKRYNLSIIQKSLDEKYDQSYFLFGLTKNNLDNIKFPLGLLKKKQTIKISHAIYLKEISSFKNSVDLCFVPSKKHYTSILKLNSVKHNVNGKIFNIYGNLLNEHQGLYKFTMGQRKKVNLLSNTNKLHVIKINYYNKSIIIGKKEFLKTKHVKVKKIVVVYNMSYWPKIINVKLRYNNIDILSYWYHNKKLNSFKLTLLHFTSIPAAVGQAVVLYYRHVVLGGGIIYS